MEGRGEGHLFVRRASSLGMVCLMAGAFAFMGEGLKKVHGVGKVPLKLGEFLPKNNAFQKCTF